MIPRPRLQLSCGKTRMVGRIRKMLRLQAKSRSLAIHLAAFARDRAVQKISRIKLNSRLSGPHLQNAPAPGIVNFCGFRKLSACAVQHPVVVVSLAESNLLVIGIDALTNRRCLPKIKWRSRHLRQLARRDQSIINRRVPARVQFYLLTQNIPASPLPPD